MADPVVHQGRFGVIIEPDLAARPVVINASSVVFGGDVSLQAGGDVGRPAEFSPLFSLGGDTRWFDSIGWATDKGGPLSYLMGAVDDGVPLCTAYEFDTGPLGTGSGGGGPEPDPGDLTLIFDNRLI